HVGGVDAGGVDGDLDPGFAGVVAGAEVGLVLGAEPVGERVVVVRRDLGVAAELQVAVGHGQVEEEHVRGRVRPQVLNFLPGGVEREGDGVAVGEEPDFRQLGAAVRAYRGQGGEPAVEQVTVGCGNLRHDAPCGGRRGAGSGARPVGRGRGQGQPPPLAAWISWILTLRAQLTASRVAPGTGLHAAGGGPSWTPTAQQARQVSVAVMFHWPGWRKVTPQSAVPFAPVWATAPGLRTISVEPR